MKETRTNKLEVGLARIAWTAILIVMLISLAVPKAALAQVVVPVPTIVSDKLDYAPAELVTLTGQNWQGDIRVHIVVDDDYDDPWILETDAEVDPYVQADGSISFAFNLPTWFIASYTVTATGVQTGRIATTSFTDAAPPRIENLFQCDPPSVFDPATYNCVAISPTGWVTGNNDGPLYEGDTVPYRTRFQNLIPGNQYSVVIGWDTTKADKHALDYLKSFNATILAADACISLTGLPAGLCSGAPNTYPIPPDTFMQSDPNWIANGGVQEPGNFVMYGGTITGLGSYVTPVSYVGDTSTTINIFFTANSTDVVMAWGGHIAKRADWGMDNSAVSIPGSPYHMHIDNWKDETNDKKLNVGVMDRSLSAEAVIYPAYITIIKQATPEGSTAFPFTTTLGTMSPLVDDGTSANTMVFEVRDTTKFTTQTITEQVPANWSLDNVVCTDTTGNPVWDGTNTISISVAEADYITCTFYNSQNVGSIVVVKDAIPNDPQDFEFSLTGQSNFFLDDDSDGTLPNSRTFTGLPVGTYALSEVNIPSGWSLTNAVCSDGSPINAISLQTDETVTCTFTNTKTTYLTVNKTANTSLTRTNTWLINKGADGSYDKFIGDPAFLHDFTVSVDKSVVDSGWAVNGDITITNSTGQSAVITGVSDVISPAISAVVNCGVTFPYTLVNGATLNCTYSASLPDAADRINTVTVTTSGANSVMGGTATAAVSFASPAVTVVGPASINITDTNGQSWGPVSDDASFSYSKEFVCPTDPSLYVNGVYNAPAYINTASITETGASDIATVDLQCYIWDVSKTANGSYQEEFGWNITKVADPASQSGFAGDVLNWNWKITWNSYLIGEVNHAVDGVITVVNPAPMPLTVAVTDVLTGGFAANVTCNDADGGTSLTVAAGSSGTCDYTAAPTSKLAQNTATATYNAIPVSDTVDVNWVKGADIGKDAVITDSNGQSIPLDSVQPYIYADSYTCSRESGSYNQSGTYTGSVSNTATISYTGGSDSSTATMNYGCYIWDVSKTANGSYQEEFGWNITKLVNPLSQSGGPGDVLSWKWSISWSSYLIGEVNHAVDGVITVVNPAPMPLTVTVSDMLTGGFIADVVCNNPLGGVQPLMAVVGDSLTVPPMSSGTCTYTALPGSKLAQNTATATYNGVSVSDTVDVTWVKGADVGMDAVITDTNGQSIPLDSVQPFEYTDSHTCSTDPKDYNANGVYTGSADNTATITYTGGSDSSTASTSYTCTMSAKIVVKKLTNPAGSLQSFEFDPSWGANFFLSDGQTNDSGWLTPGVVYSVAELPVSGWDLTSATCDDGSLPSAISLEPGETVTCTFTNTQRGKIVVDKVTVPAGSQVEFEFNPSWTDTNFFLADGSTPLESALLVPGTYSVEELAKTGWDLTNVTCTDGSPASAIVLGAGETVTCTFTNTQRGQIIVDKVTLPAGSAQLFEFNPSWSEANFSLADATTPQNSGYLVPGTYSVEEVNIPAGWDLTNVSCSNGSPASAIVLGAGETVTCTFTNTQRGQIIVDKITVPAGDPQLFEFNPSWSEANFSLADATTPHNSGNLVPGTYSVEEVNIPSGWILTSVSCGDGSKPDAISLDPGEIVTCTFTNTKVAARISITPLADVNKVGDPHTFTILVEKYEGDVWVPVTGVNPVVDINPAPSSKTDNCALTGTDSNGQCTVVINSTVAAVYTVNASVTVNVLGQDILLTTVGKTGTYGPAVKTYVDARISISPLTAFNEVGDAHTFTVLVEANLGAGWVPVPAVFPVVDINPAPSSKTDNCAVTGTDSNGQCTVVINSTVAAVYTANASANVSVLGQSIAVTTVGKIETYGPAVKTYVDAHISISPLTATNNITEPHTFTVKVEANDGSGWAAVAGVKPVVVIAPLPGSVVDNCASTGTNAAGECTVVINSNVPGIFTANATVTLTVQGVELVRTTNGTGGNSAAAVKTYLASSLEITKVVIWGGYTPDPTKEFEICITGPSYPETPNCKKADFDGGVLTWSDIIPGSYIVTETNPGAEWSVVIASSPVTVPPDGGKGTATVTNTLLLGGLEVTKIVDWGLAIYEPARLFNICIKGTSFPLGTELGACKTVGADGGVLLWDKLLPGIYTVTEDNPGGEWQVVYTGTPATVVANAVAQASITNRNTDITAVTLKYFRIESVAGKEVKLGWATLIEVDNLGFEIFRSEVNNYETAQSIGFVPSQVGTGAERVYSFLDTVPEYGRYFYWLVDVSKSGQYTLEGNPLSGLVATTSEFKTYLPGVSR